MDPDSSADRRSSVYWNDASWWAWIPMTLAMVAVWGLLVWGAVQLIGGRRQVDRQPPPPPPRELLDERLARGEINADEYRELRRLLEDRAPERDQAGSPSA
jgi:putative membrane protein